MPKRGASEVEVLESAGMMRWLLTYADMITLLLIVFVILFAISTLSPRKFQSFEKGIIPALAPGVNPLEKGVGVLQNNSVLLHIGQQSVTAMIQAANNVQGTPLQSVTAATSSALAQEIEKALQQAGLAQYASVEVTPQGTVVEILASTSFASYSATLTGIGEQVVDTVAGVVVHRPNDMLIGGYTDDNPVVCTPDPVACPFRNNWALSAARASTVTTRLGTSDAIAWTRLFGWFAGSNDPVAPNRDASGNAIPANQALNRRVDIEILNASPSGQVGSPNPTSVAPPALRYAPSAGTGATAGAGPGAPTAPATGAPAASSAGG